ncbi:MAG: hypothetical protein AAF378_16715 [Cyanobacteria bacterium P01_A01_bin.84]
MHLERQKIYDLIEKLSDEEIEKVWNTIYCLHCDFCTMKAIEQAQRSQQPWNILTYEEAKSLFSH